MVKNRFFSLAFSECDPKNNEGVVCEEKADDKK